MKKKKGEDGVFHEADVASLRTLKWTEEVDGRQVGDFFILAIYLGTTKPYASNTMFLPVQGRSAELPLPNHQVQSLNTTYRQEQKPRISEHQKSLPRMQPRQTRHFNRIGTANFDWHSLI